MLTLSFRAQISVNWVNNFYSSYAGTHVGASIINDSKNRVYSTGSNGHSFVMRFNENNGARKWYDSIINTTAVKIKNDYNDFIYFIGTYHNATSTTDNADVYLSKYDSLGNKLWQFTYNDSLDFGDYPVDIEFDNLGNVYMVCNTERTSNLPAYRNNITLFKISPQGNLIWKKFYGDVSANSETAYDLVLDSNFNLYVAGATTQYSGTSDFLVQKFDNNGNTSWYYYYNFNPSSGSQVDVAENIQINNANELIVSGTLEAYGGGVGTSYIVKLSMAGSKIWDKTIKVGNFKRVKFMSIDGNDNIYLVINADGSVLYGHYIYKINTSGTVITSNLSDNLIAGSSSFDGYDVIGAFADKHSNIYVTGTNGQQLLRDCFIIKYDSLCQKKWKYFYTTQASNNIEEGHGITVDTLLNIYVTGMFQQSGQIPERMLNVKFCQIKDYCGLSSIATQSVNFNIQSSASVKFNNDNFYDIVYCDSLNNKLYVYNGNVNNTYTYNSVFSFSWSPSGIKSSDVNHDGFEDIILYNSTDDNIAVFLLNGTNTLPTPVFYNSSLNTKQILIADFNKDNYSDIFSQSATQNVYSILLNNGNGTFSSPVNVSNSSGFNIISLGDINKDGYTDVVASSGMTNLIYVYKNSNTLSFTSSFISSSVFVRFKLIVDDFDGDGIQDIAEFANNGTAKFYKGSLSGSFSGGIPALNISTQISDVISADFNNDKKADLFFADKNTSKLQMYLSNTCTNSLQSYASYSLNMPAGQLTNLNIGAKNCVVNSVNTATSVALWTNKCPINMYSSTGVLTSDEMPSQGIKTELISVYPNPFNEKVYVEINDGIERIEIFNSMGQVVKSDKFTNKQFAEIETSNLSPGIYFMKYYGEKTEGAIKIVKQN